MSRATTVERPTIRHVDEQRLETDLEYRFRYLSEFIGFGKSDVEAIHGAAELLAPMVPDLVDAVYDKLFQYDATKRHFLPRGQGYEGALAGDLDSLTLDHEQIRFRKTHLGNYLVKLVTADYDARLVSYLDTVGAMHTDRAGNPRLRVPLVQMNALLGFVADALTGAVAQLDLDPGTRLRTLRAFGKLLWLQSDLINRHYAEDASDAAGACHDPC